MNTTNKEDWPVPLDCTAYAIHTTDENCKDRNLVREMISIADLTGSSYNAGSWASPLFVIPNDESAHADIQMLLDDAGIAWSFTNRTYAKTA